MFLQFCLNMHLFYIFIPIEEKGFAFEGVAVEDGEERLREAGVDQEEQHQPGASEAPRKESPSSPEMNCPEEGKRAC